MWSGRVRRRKLRRLARRARSLKPIALPIGLKVYAAIFPETPEPDQLPRKHWEWCTIVETVKTTREKFQHHVVSFNGETFKKLTRDLHVKTTTNRWRRVTGAARVNKKSLWWYGGNHPEECEPQRLATELEVHAYAQGFIPRPGWRLFSTPDGNLNKLEEKVLPEPEKVWAFTEDPETEEEAAERKLDESKARDSEKLRRARLFFAKAEREEAKAKERKQKWKAKVAYYERKKAKS